MQPPSCQRGVTLIEVLVAVLILSLGLLGVAAMQTKSLSMNHSAYMRSQANSMAYDVIDRMRANRGAALSGAYNHQRKAAAPAGGSVAATDVRDWLSDLEVTLPDGLGEILLSNGNRVSVTVEWRDRDGETQAFVTVTDL
ncbi:MULTISPECIES: type IV pilus modification protein PilV [Halomonadaceae]|uniref:type IV pilus modification protein PilV n=1 Tax=Halomonadaceae TaxID=28256 RepID=UPI00159A32DB|nr:MULTISPECIES: type IV pilus modification protein PilV [Halomonas]QJQ94283.1 type IV pilus modification protein PilV [Halomonas sp. PA5]